MKIFILSLLFSFSFSYKTYGKVLLNDKQHLSATSYQNIKEFKELEKNSDYKNLFKIKFYNKDQDLIYNNYYEDEEFKISKNNINTKEKKKDVLIFDIKQDNVILQQDQLQNYKVYFEIIENHVEVIVFHEDNNYDLYEREIMIFKETSEYYDEMDSNLHTDQIDYNRLNEKFNNYYDKYEISVILKKINTKKYIRKSKEKGSKEKSTVLKGKRFKAEIVLNQKLIFEKYAVDDFKERQIPNIGDVLATSSRKTYNTNYDVLVNNSINNIKKEILNLPNDTNENLDIKINLEDVYTITEQKRLNRHYGLVLTFINKTRSMIIDQKSNINLDWYKFQTLNLVYEGIPVNKSISFVNEKDLKKFAGTIQKKISNDEQIPIFSLTPGVIFKTEDGQKTIFANAQ